MTESVDDTDEIAEREREEAFRALPPEHKGLSLARTFFRRAVCLVQIKLDYPVPLPIPTDDDAVSEAKVYRRARLWVVRSLGWSGQRDLLDCATALFPERLAPLTDRTVEWDGAAARWLSDELELRCDEAGIDHIQWSDREYLQAFDPEIAVIRLESMEEYHRLLTERETTPVEQVQKSIIPYEDFPLFDPPPTAPVLPLPGWAPINTVLSSGFTPAPPAIDAPPTNAPVASPAVAETRPPLRISGRSGKSRTATKRVHGGGRTKMRVK